MLCLSRRLDDGTAAFADVYLDPWSPSDAEVTRYSLELVAGLGDENPCELDFPAR